MSMSRKIHIGKWDVLFLSLFFIKAAALLGHEPPFNISAVDTKDIQLLIDKHPAKKLDACVVRNFIITSVKAVEPLKRYFSNRTIENELPFEMDMVIQFPWRQVTTSQYEVDYARLGNWKLLFGPEISMSIKYGPMNPYILRKIIFVEKKYCDAGKLIECTSVTLVPKWIEPSSIWEKGMVKKLDLDGWNITRYKMKSKGVYYEADKVEWLAAGGSLKGNINSFPVIRDTNVIELNTHEYVVRCYVPN